MDDKGPAHQSETYRQIVELSPDGIIVSRNGQMVFVNPAAVRLFGASSAEEVLGHSPLSFFPAERHEAICQRVATLSSGGAVSPAEETIIGLNGRRTEVEITGTALGDPVDGMMQVIIREIGERKLAEQAVRDSEERLSLAFQGAQEGVWDWSLETGAVVYSAHWKRMLGYSDEEIEPHVSAWERLLHPEDRAAAQEVIDGVLRGERDYTVEFRLRHKDGHYVHMLSRGFPVRRNGFVERIVGTHFDLTERKRTEDALRRAQEELEQRVRERTAELAQANVALREEIGERRRAEQARTELLTRLVFAQEDERKRIAREMHDQFGEQLTSLGLGIRQLKEACASDNGLQVQIETLERVAHQLDRDVDQLVWELRPTALDDLGLGAALDNYAQDWSQRTGVRADVHTAGLSVARLSSQIETTMYRIAQEALNNVAKHARAENVGIILERRGDQVSLIIEDDGVGIEATQTGPSSHGFGLLGMQERAALVGANLQIESAPGGGTTIIVRVQVSETVVVRHG